MHNKTPKTSALSLKKKYYSKKLKAITSLNNCTCRRFAKSVPSLTQ